MDGLESGTQFDFTYAPGTSIEQIIGFEMAGQIWSSHLEDNVTVRIHVEATNQLPEDVIGAALPGKKQEADYKELQEKLSQDYTSLDDSIALGNLPSQSKKDQKEFKEFGVFVNGQELNKTKEFKLTNANAKALDLLDDKPKDLDGYIVVNDLTGQSGTSWDYDALQGGGVNSGQLDFLSVALHEVGHVLGFVSGIDDEGWLEVLTESQEKEEELKADAFEFASPLDLFRYSDNDQSTGKIDLSAGGNPYFSLDGGKTNLGNFATGEYSDDPDGDGDGFQASHWRDGNNIGIMDPVLRTGERKNVSNLDLKAFDVIGWDINNSSVNWQELYDRAVQESETAPIFDRTKDVEKMVKESGYDFRRFRSSSRSRGSIYTWQVGLWQYTSLDDVAAAEIPELVDSVPEVDPTIDDLSQPTDDLGVQAVATDEQRQDPLLSGGWIDDTESWGDDFSLYV